MKALVYHQYGSPDNLQITDVSEPVVSKGNALVRIKSVALNPRDSAIRYGKFKVLTGKTFPKLIGADFSGTLEKVPANEEGFSVGDDVFGYFESLRDGVSAEVASIPVKYLARKPAELSHSVASTLGCAYLTAFQALRDKAELKKGQTILIYGASGGVGTAAIQLAKYFEANVIAVSNSRNEAYCMKQGADKFIPYDQQDVFSYKDKVDCFFQVYAGQGNIYSQARKIMKKSGCFITVIPNPLFKIRHLFSKPKLSIMNVSNKPADLELLASLTTNGIIAPVIDDYYQAKEAVKAYQKLENNEHKGKLVLDFNGINNT